MNQPTKIALRPIKGEINEQFSVEDKRNLTLHQVKMTKRLIAALDNEDLSSVLPTNNDRTMYIEVDSFRYFLAIKWVSPIISDSCVVASRLIYFEKKIFLISDLRVVGFFREVSSVLAFHRRSLINKMLISVGAPPCCGEFYINEEGKKVDYALMISLLYREEVFFTRHPVPGKSLHVAGDYYVCSINPQIDFSAYLTS